MTKYIVTLHYGGSALTTRHEFDEYEHMIATIMQPGVVKAEIEFVS